MPRIYKRRLGSRRYKDYSEETLKAALEAINSGQSQRSVSRIFGISRGTLRNKLKGFHMKTPGGQTVLSKEMESSISQHCIALSEFGFPIDTLDLRYIVKGVLDESGVRNPAFTDNFPGVDWARGFLCRNQSLTNRISGNITAKRAGKTEQEMKTYFDHLKLELDGVPPGNIYNYDETNLSDNPGKKKTICRRGSKYPEKIANGSKASVSLMFCGNAEGQLLPPYVVYKSEHLWDSWTEGGPSGTRYNRSKSGWFDGFCFSDWFFKTVLPVLRRKTGKKVLVGDNLSSHINRKVIETCNQHNIAFICLPPNSTHLTQPLDIAYFRPLKTVWKDILTKWKANSISSSTMPKDVFPKMLKDLWNKLQEGDRSLQNLKSGFNKAGLFPLNQNRVLERLQPHTEQLQFVQGNFLKKLEQMRHHKIAPRKQKKKRIDVVPGKSVSNEEAQHVASKRAKIKKSSKVLSKSRRKSASNENRNKTVRPKRVKIVSSPVSGSANRKSSCEVVSEEMSDSDASFNIAAPTTSPRRRILSETESDAEDDQVSAANDHPSVGQYVVVQYEGVEYPGIVKVVEEKGAEVSVMEPVGKGDLWKWPIRKDQIFYSWEAVFGEIEPPDLVNSRGLYRVYGVIH